MLNTNINITWIVSLSYFSNIPQPKISLEFCFRMGINFYVRFEVPFLLKIMTTVVQVIISCNLVDKQAITRSEQNDTSFFRIRWLLSFQNKHQQDDTYGLSFISRLVVLYSTCFELQEAHHQEFTFSTLYRQSLAYCIVFCCIPPVLLRVLSREQNT